MISSGLVKGYPFHLESYSSGSAAYPTVTGSVVSMLFSSTGEGYGHVGIIRTLRQLDNGGFEGVLFDQHGAIHQGAGFHIQPDSVVFHKNNQGFWEGEVHSWKYRRYYPVTSWLNVVAD